MGFPIQTPALLEGLQGWQTEMLLKSLVAEVPVQPVVSLSEIPGF